MNVLAVLGSPRKTSNSEIIAGSVLKAAEAAGATTTRIRLCDLKFSGCVSCMYCRTHEGCSQKDDLQKVYRAIDAADVLVIGFPIYMWAMNGQTKSFIDRLFPYLKADYTPRAKRRTVLCISQGQADKAAFKANIDWATNVLGFLGFPVSDVIVEGNGNEPGAFSKRKELLSHAESVGKELVS